MAFIGMSSSHLKTSKYLANNSDIFGNTRHLCSSSVYLWFTCGFIVANTQQGIGC